MLLANITFKPITEKDLPFIREVYNYFVENSTATYHTHLLSLDEIKALTLFNNKRYQTFLISVNNESVGYIYLSPYGVREAYNYTGNVTIYIKKEFNGIGIGTVACAFIEEFAKKNDFHTLIMTISADNASSMRNAQKCGYTQCGYLKQAGFKFGKWLDVAIFQKHI